MAKTLCRLSLTDGSQFYLNQDDQNNLVVSANYIGVQPSNNVVIMDVGNKCKDNFGDKFLSGQVFNETDVAVLFNATKYNSLKDLLEKGLKIPLHQMPNLPNNNQHNQQDQIVVNNNPNVLMDANTLFYGNEYYPEYENSDFIITQRARHNNSPIKDYSKHVGETTYYYS